MDATITKAEAPSFATAATGSRLHRAVTAAARGVAALLRGLAGFPERLATYNALRRLSDRELTDIGMTRYDIGRIFDPSLSPRPANDAGERPAPRAA